MKSRKVDNFNVGSYYKVTLEDSRLYGNIIKITRSNHHERFYTTVFCASNKPDYFYIDSGAGQFDINSTFAEYLVPCTHKLVVLQDGNKTIVKHYVDGKLLEEKVAKCHPDDDYSFETGSKIALDRLFENMNKSTATDQKVYEHKRNALDWGKFCNGEIAVQVTRETIQDFLEECDKHNISWDDSHNASDGNIFERWDNLDLQIKLLWKFLNVEIYDCMLIGVEGRHLKYKSAYVINTKVYVWQNEFDWGKFENGELYVRLTKETEMNFLKECGKRGYLWGDGTTTLKYVPSIEEYFVISGDYEKLIYWNKVANKDKDVVIW